MLWGEFNCIVFVRKSQGKIDHVVGAFLGVLRRECSFRLFPRQGGCGKYKSKQSQICQRFALIDTYNGKYSV